MDDFEKESIKLLQDLIRIPTVGRDETKAAKIIRKFLKKNKIKSKIIESEKGRGNLIARIKGNKPDAHSIILSGHLDVVGIEGQEWSVEPFSGLLKDGYVWGRGSLDMKGIVAAQVVALTRIKREGYKPEGDIILLCSADEEQGGNMGIGYMVENHFDEIKADVALNEGGGTKHGHRYLLQYAEKGGFWVKLKVKGEGGHASRPWAGDNALVKACEIVLKIANYKIPQSVNKYVKDTIDNFGLPKERAESLHDKETLKNFLKEDSGLADIVLPTLSMTATPTILNTNNKNTNNIPTECEINLDCRLLPGEDKAELENVLKDAIGEELWKDVEISYIKNWKGNDCSRDNQHYENLVTTIKEVDPGCKIGPKCLVVPFMAPWCTDLKYFRKKGMPAYGFTPFKDDKNGLTVEKSMELFHAADERLSVDNLMLNMEFFYRLLRKY